MKLSKILLVVLSVIFIGQLVYFYPQLPATIASHFNASGQANDWMSKSSFYIFEVILLLFFLAIGLFLPRLLFSLPDSMINLPNKEYWLAPERREQTLNSFGESFSWIFVGVIALFVAINQVVLQANVLQQDPSAVVLWAILGVFFVFDLIIIISSIRKFSGSGK